MRSTHLAMPLCHETDTHQGIYYVEHYRDITLLRRAHPNTPCFVLGTGPSLNDFIANYQRLPKNAIVIGCNDVPEIAPHVFLNYYVLANSQLIPTKSVGRIRSMPRTNLVYADSVDRTPRLIVEEVLNTPYFGYDQRHFKSQKCDQCPDGCTNLINGRKTIQELLQRESGHSDHYSTGSTVTLHSTALAVIMRCNPILIWGVELDYSLGYASNSLKPDNYSFESDLTEILNDFLIIRDSAKLLNLTISNMSSVSKLRGVLGQAVVKLG
jgi:hypothetical protein